MKINRLLVSAAVFSGLTFFLFNPPHLQAQDTPLDKEHHHIYIGIGQSNMCGRATIEPQDTGYIDRVFLLRPGDTLWEKAKNPINKYNTLSDTGSLLGPCWGFAKIISASQTNISIGLIGNAKGGTSLSQWVKGTFYFHEAVRRTKSAQKTGTLKGILWHQGENDYNDTNYVTKLAVFIKDLRDSLGDPNLLFVAGQIYASSPARATWNRILMEKLPKLVPNTAVISSDGCTMKSDNLHFDSPGQRLLGSRYGDTVLKMNYVPPSAPTNLSASSVTQTTATLSWTASNGATSYTIQASVNSDFSTPLIKQTGFSGTSDPITGLTPGATYYWRVSATNAGGTSGWALGSFTTIAPQSVTYDGNGSTGGTAPTDANSYQQGATVTVLGNTGSLVKTGSTFSGWNTAANGSGTSYAGAATFSMGTANVTLYAQWNINTYTLSLAHVIRTAAPVADRDTTVNYGDTVRVTAPAISGTIFVVWRITAGTAVLVDSTAQPAKVVLTSGNATLTAVYDVPSGVLNRRNSLPTSFDFSYNAGLSSIRIAVPRIAGYSSVPVRVRLFDARGRFLSILVNKEMQAGYYDLRLNEGNSAMPVWGICRMDAKGFSRTVKAICVK